MGIVSTGRNLVSEGSALYAEMLRSLTHCRRSHEDSRRSPTSRRRRVPTGDAAARARLLGDILGGGRIYTDYGPETNGGTPIGQ